MQRFEEQPLTDQNIEEQTYYDQGILMVAMVKAGVELGRDHGFRRHHRRVGLLRVTPRTPLIANTIARKKLYEMNVDLSYLSRQLSL